MNTRKTPIKSTTEGGVSSVQSSPVHGTRSRTVATTPVSLNARNASSRTPGGKKGEDKKQERERRKQEEEALKMSQKKPRKPRVTTAHGSEQDSETSDTEKRGNGEKTVHFSEESSEDDGDEKDPEELLQNGRESKGHLAEAAAKAENGKGTDRNEEDNTQANGKAGHDGSEDGEGKVEGNGNLAKPEPHKEGTNGVAKPAEPSSTEEETSPPSHSPKENRDQADDEKEDEEASKQNGSEDEVRLLKASKRREMEGDSLITLEEETTTTISIKVESIANGKVDSSFVVPPASTKLLSRQEQSSNNDEAEPRTLEGEEKDKDKGKSPVEEEELVSEEEAQRRKEREDEILREHQLRWSLEMARRQRVSQAERRKQVRMDAKLQRQLEHAWDEEFRCRGVGGPAPLPSGDSSPFVGDSTDYLVGIKEEKEESEEVAEAEEGVGTQSIMDSYEKELAKAKKLLHERDSQIKQLLDEKLALSSRETYTDLEHSPGASSGGVSFWEELQQERTERQQLEQYLEAARQNELQLAQQLNEKEEEVMRLHGKKRRQDHITSGTGTSPKKRRQDYEAGQPSTPPVNSGENEGVVEEHEDKEGEGSSERNKLGRRFTKQGMYTSLVLGVGIAAAAVAQGAIEGLSLI